MALRLGEFVLYGEIRNTSNYSTHGFVVLRTAGKSGQAVMRFELAGNPAADLRGKTVRFWPGIGEPEEFFNEVKFGIVRLRQIGPTSHMSADGWVRALPCPVEEYLQRSRLGEPPPAHWARRLYLEWYGQNGRVVVEMVDPVVEHRVRAPADGDDEGDWEPLPSLSLPPDLFDTHPPADFDDIELAPEFDLEDIAPTREQFEPVDALQRQLDQESEAIDQAIFDSDDEDSDAEDSFSDHFDFQEEHDLLDAIAEGDGDMPIESLIGDLTKRPRPDSLDDTEVESHLKTLLADLAMHGIALDVCEHLTPRDCYRLLLESILPELTTHEKLAQTDTVMHLTTWESCPQCEAECRAQYERDFGPEDPD